MNGIIPKRCFSVFLMLGPLWGQSAEQQPKSDSAGSPVIVGVQRRPPTDYVLGPNDQLSIWALGVSEIPDKPLQIDEAGFVDVPMLGKIQAAGLTVSQFKDELFKRLAVYVQSPQATVSVTEHHSRPVLVAGAVNRPGNYQLRYRATLLDALSAAGGLSSDAGQFVRITRDADSLCTPLPGAAESSSSASINGKILFDANPEANLVLCAHDIVSVPSAEMVYVVGEVQKPGGFAMTSRTTYTVLRALSLAGGTTYMAALGDARILRDWQGPERKEIPIDLKKARSPIGEDIALKPGDILFVPSSTVKIVGKKAIDAAIQLAVGVAVFRR